MVICSCPDYKPQEQTLLALQNQNLRNLRRTFDVLKMGVAHCQAEVPQHIIPLSSSSSLDYQYLSYTVEEIRAQRLKQAQKRLQTNELGRFVKLNLGRNIIQRKYV